MSFILVFLDGVGIGESDSEKNPFFQYSFELFTDIFKTTPSLENLKEISENAAFFPIDACLEVEGLPQSGTGQTAILTGRNASKIVGKHFGPFPYSTLLPILENESIFTELKECGKNVNFTNAYPKIFFDYINSGKRRLGAFAYSCLLSKVKLNNYDDLKSGNALSAEIDNHRWIEKLNYDLELLTPQAAAKNLISAADASDLTVFEYFLSDHLGHRRKIGDIEKLIETLDKFLKSLIEQLPQDFTLLICSDHGNLEDLSIKTHTYNPALGIAAGKNFHFLAESIKSLTDIKWQVLKCII